MAYGISNAQISNLSTAVTDTSVGTKVTDAANGSAEYSWQNTYWSKYWGYFNTIPELKSALLMKATWDVGKGYETDPETGVILEHVTGWGKDTFLDVLFNMDLISRLAGDSFAEIIRNEETGVLLNLKVLDPSSVKIVTDDKGIIIRYEQTNKVSKKIISWKPSEIFHLS